MTILSTDFLEEEGLALDLKGWGARDWRRGGASGSKHGGWRNKGRSLVPTGVGCCVWGLREGYCGRGAMQSRLGDSGLLGFWETLQQLQAGESRVQNKSLSKVNFLGNLLHGYFKGAPVSA